MVPAPYTEPVPVSSDHEPSQTFSEKGPGGKAVISKILAQNNQMKSSIKYFTFISIKGGGFPPFFFLGSGQVVIMHLIPVSLPSIIFYKRRVCRVLHNCMKQHETTKCKKSPDCSTSDKIKILTIKSRLIF